MSGILVTGAGGFIGRNLVRRLLAQGESVIALDRDTSRDDHEPADLGAGDRFVEVVCDADDSGRLAELFHQHRPRVVISLAEGLRGPISEVVADSAAAQAGLFRAALSAGVGRVCLASSLVVYMGLDGPFREDMPLPVGSSLHIGAIKKASEVIGQWYAEVSPLEVVALRLANIYGPRYHSMMNTPSRYLFEAMGRPAAQGRPPLDPGVYRQLADFCHVDDCCEGIQLVANAPKLQHRVYNIGGGRGVTDGDIRRAVGRAIGRNDVGEETEALQTYMDISRIADELGYRPRHDIDSGMLAYRAWLERHPR